MQLKISKYILSKINIVKLGKIVVQGKTKKFLAHFAIELVFKKRRGTFFSA